MITINTWLIQKLPRKEYESVLPRSTELMNVPVLGVVENMSYFQCPDCGGRHAIFGESHVKDIAEKHGIERVASVPIDPAIAKASDEGTLGSLEQDWLKDLAAGIRAVLE